MIGRWIEALLGRFGYIKLTAYRRALLDKGLAAPTQALLSDQPSPLPHRAPLTLPVSESVAMRPASSLRPHRVAHGTSDRWRQPAADFEGRTRVYVGDRYRWNR